MKVLTVANQKGGVGKTYISTQFAFYAHDRCGLRTAVIDVDAQHNTTNLLLRSNQNGSKRVKQSEISSAKFFSPKTQEKLKSPAPGDFSDFTVFASNRKELLAVQLNTHQDTEEDAFIASVKALNEHFDIVIIDTAPNEDIRSQSALGACTHVLAPLQISSECLDGMQDFMDMINEAAPRNPDILDGFLGIIPNMFQQSNYQKKGIGEFIIQIGNLMLQTDNFFFLQDESGQLKRDEAGNLLMGKKHEFSVLSLHDTCKVAQDKAIPVWEVQNYATPASREAKQAFWTIIERMAPDRKPVLNQAEINALMQARNKIGKFADLAIRQFWMTDDQAYLPGVAVTSAQTIRDLRMKIPVSFLNLSLANQVPEI